MGTKRTRKMIKTVGVVRERERESNRLEKVAQICDARNVSIINKIDKHKRIDYIANRRKEKLLFTG